MENKTYIAIDLKSFYASVECVERGLNPMTTHLVVADKSRTEKTICLAVTPSLKALGIPRRARLFEVSAKVRKVNAERQQNAPRRVFTGSSFDATVLNAHPEYRLDFIVAPPRMAHYMEFSTRIYQIYLKYIAPEDIHVYSIDEVFIDATDYLGIYKLSARELAMKMILDVLESTGITATAGIGTNLYLCKIALDIQAKHIPADHNGVRIAELDEMSYRRLFWSHRPLTDFWRIGKGYAKKLEDHGLYTMGDIARCSLGSVADRYNEDMLYKLFGVSAELLIDHAWGYEPCTIADIRAYKPESNSLGSGQVLKCPYTFQKAKLVVREMADSLALDLVDKKLMTDQIVLTVGYDVENLSDPGIRGGYSGAVTTDRYGRQIPKHANGTANLGKYSSSSKLIIDAASGLFERITDKKLLIRRLYLTANRVKGEGSVPEDTGGEQLDIFTDYTKEEEKRKAEALELARERKKQEAMLDIKRKYGKNAILKGMNLEDGATAQDRNQQIGGHKA